MMNNAQESTFRPEDIDASPHDIRDFERAGRPPAERTEAVYPRKHGFLNLVAELRRRRVCRAATLYAVAMWLICQIVELVYKALGLPEWTLKLVIVLGLLGFPIALILSWMIDITPNGLVIDNPRNVPQVANDSEARGPFDQVIDCSLLLLALFIGAQLAIGVLSTESNAAQSHAQKIAVELISVPSENGAEILSQSLVVNLQHELASKTQMTVIVPREPNRTSDSLILSGVVAVSEKRIHITATMIDNKTREVTWSQSFEWPRTDLLSVQAEIAQEIVAAIPAPFRTARLGETDHAT